MICLINYLNANMAEDVRVRKCVLGFVSGREGVRERSRMGSNPYARAVSSRSQR